MVVVKVKNAAEKLCSIFPRYFFHAFNTELEKFKALFGTMVLYKIAVFVSYIVLIEIWYQDAGLGLAVVGNKFNIKLSSVSPVKITQIKSMRSLLMKALLGFQNPSEFVSNKMFFWIKHNAKQKVKMLSMKI